MSTKAEVQAQIAALFPDNLSRKISPEDLRDVTLNMLDVTATQELVGEEFAPQVPAGLDLPLQITFGPDQLGDPDVTIAADGTVTFLTPGQYRYDLKLYVTRTTVVGEANILVRGLINGVQFGNPVGMVLADANTTSPLLLDGILLIGAADVPLAYTAEIVRDSSGIDNGGLTGITTLVGWGNTPSARIQIVKEV